MQCSHCDKKALYADGLCRSHHEKWLRHGDPLVRQRAEWNQPCGVEDDDGEPCPEPAKARGLCHKHYMRLKTHGTVAKKVPPVKPIVRGFVCAVCGCSFQRKTKPGRPPTVCSDDCKAERSRRQAKEWRKENPQRFSEQPSRQPDAKKEYFRTWYEANKEQTIKRSIEYQRRNAKDKAARDSKYRALKRGSVGAEKFTLDEIFERDNQTCYLCGKAVTRRDATMDHVIPITKGGPHTRANVKLAHRGCNARKSDRILLD